MFEMFDGYGSELATMLWVVFIPVALATAKWYANYIRDKALAAEKNIEFNATLKKLGETVEKLETASDKFDKFIVAYEAVQKAKKEGTGSFRRPDLKKP